MTLAGTRVSPEAGRHVVAAQRLQGELRLPSDKSIAHRALLFNAMAAGTADVDVRRAGADVRSTAAALEALGGLDGVRAVDAETSRFRIRGGGTARGASLPGSGGETIDCGNSGTTVRFLSGALAGRRKPGDAGNDTTLVGDASLSSRPMERVAVPLRRMGAEIETHGGSLPIRVRGRASLDAMEHVLPVASAQVLGAISLAALAADGRTTIVTPGATRDHTERLLGWLGAPVQRDGTTTTVDGPSGFQARSLVVPGDLSSAAAWLVAATLHPDAQITLRDVSLNPSRLAIVDVLREMGASIEIAPAESGSGPEPSGDLLVRTAPVLRPITLAGSRISELIDELPLLAVAMAAADGVSEVRDAGELRVKESDRIALVVASLRAIGVEVEELADGWRIVGRRPSPGALRRAPQAHEGVLIETRRDHRIAIAFAVAAATGQAPAVQIDDPACIDVSYPGFWADLDLLAGAAA